MKGVKATKNQVRVRMRCSCSFILRKTGTVILLAVGFLLLILGPAEAHRVNVFAWVEGDTVYTESRFSGGREVNEGWIIVYDDQTGEKLLEGRTDAGGKFSFKVPRLSPLRIEMTAGMGHKNEWIVPAEEIAAAGGDVPETPAAVQEAGADASTRKEASATLSTTPAGAAQIEQVVEKVLDRKLSPVVKLMAESRQHRTTFSDVIGGIGYILGLVGLATYTELLIIVIGIILLGFEMFVFPGFGISGIAGIICISPTAPAQDSAVESNSDSW